MSLFENSGAMSHIHTLAQEVYDVSGAGDTVISTLTLALAVGASFKEAAVTANCAAGITVGEIGVATTTQIDSQDPEALVRAADAALYEAKQAGRDRVVAFSPQAVNAPGG